MMRGRVDRWLVSHSDVVVGQEPGVEDAFPWCLRVVVDPSVAAVQRWGGSRGACGSG